MDDDEGCWLLLPLAESTDKARLLLTDLSLSSAGAVFKGVDTLLTCCIMHPEADNTALREVLLSKNTNILLFLIVNIDNTLQVAMLVRDLSSRHPNIAQVLLTHLPSLPSPLPFIDIVPTLFAAASPEVV